MTSRTAFISLLCGLLYLAVIAVPTTATRITIPIDGGCAVVLCAQGTKCIETPTGPRCVPSTRFCICTLLFNPVCCKTPFGLKTTDNACLCECRTTNTVISENPCPTCALVECKKGFKCIETRSGPKCVPIGTCSCSREFNPVCCKLPSGKIVRKNNPCLCLKCNPGADIIVGGPCPVITLPPVTAPMPTEAVEN